MKMRVSVRKGLAPLLWWTDFAYGTSDPYGEGGPVTAPWLQSWIKRMDETSREAVRTTTKDILQAVAAARRTAMEFGPSPRMPLDVPLDYIATFNLPPRGGRLSVFAEHLAFYDGGDFVRDELIPALTKIIVGPRNPVTTRETQAAQAWQRLRICACGVVFVALVPQAEHCRRCSNRSRQRKFYQTHTTQERQRKLDAYHMARLRLAAGQRAKPLLRVVPGRRVTKG